MKKVLPLLVLCISFFAAAQEVKRENIQGNIIVEGNDIEGITIFNTSSNIGAVSNENGEFTIAVALKDVLQIRALEYENFDVMVNDAILESKTVSIFLIEEINKLEEVVISTKKLTGNISSDINSIQTFSLKRDAIYFGMKDKNGINVNDTRLGEIENAITYGEGQSMIHGLNVINIVDQLLIPLFRSEVKDKKAAGIPQVPSESIKYYLGSTFLVENFNIPEHRVEEFIRYVEDDTFDFDLLNYGHELEFLEILSKRSKVFLNTENDKD